MRIDHLLFAVMLMLPLGFLQCGKNPAGPDKKTEKGWSALPLDIAERKVQCIAVQSDNAATLYVGLFDGLYKSTDSGKSWRGITAGLISRDIHSLEIVAGKPQVLYAGSNGFGISRSEDYGESWVNMRGGVENTLVDQIHLVNQHDEVIWLATATGLYSKKRDELTWTDTYPGCRLVHSITTLPGKPDTVLAGLLYIGFIRGAFNASLRRWSWTAVNNGIPERSGNHDCPNQIGFAGPDSSLVYAVTQDGHFYISQDDGLHWERKYYTADTETGVAMITHPKLRDRLYLATRHQVYRSTNRGATWTRLTRNMPAVTITALQVAPGDPGVIYIGTEDNGLYHYVEAE
ncbi:MAG TPA: hypothetical protein PLG50_04305 [bacterium]|nr:hypothetical protein [bacterium]HQG44858.1 hypothetical protein [bacterium]HQJ64025.1 hypothetical protein [bacterium]